MAYDDRFYYGQCSVVVIAPKHSEVTISGGNFNQTQIVQNDRVTFLVPPTQVYTVTVGDESEKLFLGYGKSIKLEF